MPLSEHEQRLLSEMEQRLLADDPRFASAMRHHTTGGRPKQRLALGLVGVLAGLGGMLVALYYHQVPLAVLAFVLMLASAYWAVTIPNRATGPQGMVRPDGGIQRPRRQSGQNRGGFSQRMEDRWERRQDRKRDL